MGVLASALRRYRSNRTLQNFQQRLLNALAGNIARDRRVLAFARNFVNLINLNDAALGALNIIICRLNKLQQNIFHILAHIAGLC